MPSHDVVELILRDHRRMEDLFRTMRNVEADRATALAEFANLLIAHASAEEDKVYPALLRYKNVDGDDVDHSVHEHEEETRHCLLCWKWKTPLRRSGRTSSKSLSRRSITTWTRKSEPCSTTPAKT